MASWRLPQSNASGTASISAVMYGPAATTTNVLVDWTCSRGGLKASGIPGHSWVGDQRTVYSDGTVTHSYSNGFGQNIGSRDQLGKLSRAIHNSRGELIKTIDADGNETSYAYDDLGRRTSTTDALQNNTSVTYDSAGRSKHQRMRKVPSQLTITMVLGD